jgi:hypothetical protein
VPADAHCADLIVQLADHVARAGASADNAETLRDLVAEHPNAAGAAYMRATKLTRDALSEHERDRWNDVAQTIATAAAASDITIQTQARPRDERLHP